MPRITSRKSREQLSPYARPVDDAGDVLLPNVSDAGVSSTPLVTSAPVDNDNPQKSRKNSADYIPRPANCFILFQSDFRRNNSRDSGKIKKGETTVQSAGAAWHRMSEKEKAPWKERAKIVDAEHKVKYPNYRYRPVYGEKKTKGDIKKKGDVRKDEKDPLQDAVQSTVQGTVRDEVQDEVQDEIQGTSEPSVQDQSDGEIQHAPLYLPNELYQYQMEPVEEQMGMGTPDFAPLPQWPEILHGGLLETNQMTFELASTPSWTAAPPYSPPQFDYIDNFPDII